MLLVGVAGVLLVGPGVGVGAAAGCQSPVISSVVAQPALVDVNTGSSNLAITLSGPLCYDQDLLTVSELNGGVIAQYNWLNTPNGRTTVTTSVSPPLNTTVTYKVTVTNAGGMVSQRNVQVTNDGWQGSFTLTADHQTVDASNGGGANLGLTLDRPLMAPYQLSVYDQDQNLVAAWPASATVWWRGNLTASQFVVVPTDTTQTFTAYVAQDAPTIGPPTNDVRLSRVVQIANLGWPGTISLTASPQTVTGANPSATLTVTLSRPLVDPYQLAVYDDQGNLVKAWNGSRFSLGTRTQATAYVTPPLSGSRTYTVYVSQDTPVPGPPAQDIQATAQVAFTNGTAGGGSINGVSIPALVTLVGAHVGTQLDQTMALDLSAMPGSTHTQGTTTSDQTNTYLSCRAGGAVADVCLSQAMTTSVAMLGEGAVGAGLGWIASQYVTLEPPPAPSDPVPPGPTGPPAEPIQVLAPGQTTFTYQQELAQTYLDRARAKRRPLTAAQAQSMAQQCVNLAQMAIVRGALDPQINGEFPCQALPVYFPGSRSSGPAAIDTTQTTQHDSDAMNPDKDGNPTWVRLNYVSSADRQARGLARGWYKTTSTCQNLGAGTQCDEYPFFASARSSTSSSLDVVSASANQAAGGSYGGFITSCRLSSGGPVTPPDPAQETGSPFLVVPLAFPGAPPTIWTCP